MTARTSWLAGKHETNTQHHRCVIHNCITCKQCLGGNKHLQRHLFLGDILSKGPHITGSTVALSKFLACVTPW